MTATLETQVGIVGAGPAGLALAHLLRTHGVDSVVLEARSREYCEQRARAGLLEPGTVRFLQGLGLDRASREGDEHEGIVLHFDGARHRIPITELGGQRTTLYPQQEVVKDLLRASDAQHGHLLFDVDDVELRDIGSSSPRIGFTQAGTRRELRCAVVAGCDGFHGVSRKAIPAHLLRIYESRTAATWFGFSVDAPPATDELVYGLSERGYAMHSMRGPSLTRLYFQYDPLTDDHPGGWPPERLWDEMATRLAVDGAWEQQEGPILDTLDFSIRAFLAEPMSYGRLFLAGDAAHIVPPTGAKGLNAALCDVALLGEALRVFFQSGDTALLDAYSGTALRRNWMMLQFSVWLTELLSVLRPGDPMELALKHAELEQLVAGGTLTRSFAERYLGTFT